VNPVKFFAGDHPFQNFGGNFRQQRMGQDVIDVPCTAIDFGAAVDDRGDQGIVIGKFRAVIVPEALLDLREFQPDDSANLVIAERIVGNHDETTEKGGTEVTQKFGPDQLNQLFLIRQFVTVFAGTDDQVVPGVGVKEDDRIAEIDDEALASSSSPLSNTW
jgi:hypothetical protein